eukprot:4126820-Lingulodinium_polyedra.AAC.1
MASRALGSAHLFFANAANARSQRWPRTGPAGQNRPTPNGSHYSSDGPCFRNFVRTFRRFGQSS